MKSFFVFLIAVGVVVLIGFGIYLSVGVPADSREVVKEIQIKRNA